MAVLFMDSAHGGNGATKWDFYNSINTQSGASPSGRTAYSVPNNTSSVLAKSFAPVPSVVVGFYAQNFLSPPGTSQYWPFRIYGDGRTTLHLTIYGSNVSGAIQVRRGAGNGTLLAESAPGVIQVDTWHHVEIRATIADSDGRCEVWVDGAKVIDFTGDTKNGGTASQPDSVGFWRANTGTMLISDIVISSASTPVGPATVWLHLPDGDGDHTDLSQEPNSGANWEKVDENPPDGDTTYVYGDTDGEFDLYTLDDLPAGTWDVLAIQTEIDARTDDGGARNLIPVLKTNGSEYRGTSTPVSASYDTYLEVWETNPDTAAAWTPAEVDALQAGVEVD